MQRQVVLRTVEVPQIQFIAGVGGHFRSQQRRARFQRCIAALRVFWPFLGHFSRSVHPDVALDDEEFFVIEGSGVAGMPGVLTPSCSATGCMPINRRLCGHTH